MSVFIDNATLVTIEDNTMACLVELFGREQWFADSNGLELHCFDAMLSGDERQNQLPEIGDLIAGCRDKTITPDGIGVSRIQSRSSGMP